MKLKFEADTNWEYIINVLEDGIDTKTVKYETIGQIFMPEMDLKLDETYSGIISLDELRQIVDYMEKLKFNEQCYNHKKLRC